VSEGAAREVEPVFAAYFEAGAVHQRDAIADHFRREAERLQARRAPGDVDASGLVLLMAQEIMALPLVDGPKGRRP
jgi:hypothetical protein